MKNLKILMTTLVIAAVFTSCSKKDDANTDNPNGTPNGTGSDVVLKPGTFTIIMNGDGYTNKTLTYVGQKGASGTSWAVIYTKDTVHGAGPDKDYSIANLYYMPPKYNATNNDSSASANGMVAFRFSGNKAISNDAWSFTDFMTFRGIFEFSFKKNLSDADAVLYMIEDGVTVGSTTVTEYDTRVKGTFTATQMKKLDILSSTPTFVNITGSFDLAVF